MKIEQIVKEMKKTLKKSKWSKDKIVHVLRDFTNLDHPKAWCEVEDYRSELERINWNVSDMFFLFFQKELDKDFIREMITHLSEDDYNMFGAAVLEHILSDVMSEYAYMVERFQRNVEKWSEIEDLIKVMEDVVWDGNRHYNI